MKRENINYFAVGSFVLTMLVVLVVTLFKITGKGVESERYYALFTNVAAVQPGNEVTYGGYQIGKVRMIEPQRVDGKTLFRIHMDIRSDWQIPEDSRAAVVATGLLASVQIDIIEGVSGKMLSVGDTIMGDDPTNTMALVNSVGSDVQKLIVQLTQQLDVVGSDLGVKMPAITAEVVDMVSSLKRSAKRIETLTNNFDGSRVNGVVGNAKEITDNLLKVSKGLGNTTKKVEELVSAGSSVLGENRSDIRTAVKDLRESLCVISQDINNIVYYLESTSRNMSEFSRQIRENPGVLLGGKNPDDGVKE